MRHCNLGNPDSDSIGRRSHPNHPPKGELTRVCMAFSSSTEPRVGYRMGGEGPALS